MISRIGDFTMLGFHRGGSRKFPKGSRARRFEDGSLQVGSRGGDPVGG